MEIWDTGQAETELEERRWGLSAQGEGERQRQRQGQRQKSKIQCWGDLLGKGEHWGWKDRSFLAAVLYVWERKGVREVGESEILRSMLDCHQFQLF